jgi:curved DNA-binding protein CbpA
MSRRSTRVAQAVMMSITGIDGNGEAFTEETGTLELGSQGCKYFSKHSLPKDSWLTVEITGEASEPAPKRLRARVVWSRKSRNLPGLFQVGVEFETPGNVWGIADPPADWPQLKRSGKSGTAAFQYEMNELLGLIETGTHYQLLQVSSDSSPAQIRQSYYALARKYHPDRHMGHPERTGSLHKIMDVITLAYRTLTDDAARRKYDRQLAASGAFTLSRQQSQAQKTAEECVAEARQCIHAQNLGGSILWLRKAVEMEPNSTKYLALLARSLSAVPSFRREAAEHLQKAIEMDPLNTAFQLQLGELYEEMKLPWRARPCYAKVLSIDAENSKALERLAALDGTAAKKKATKRGWVERVLRHSSE